MYLQQLIQNVGFEIVHDHTQNIVVIFGLSLENTTTFISIANDDYCTFSPFPLTEAFPLVAVPSFSTSTIAVAITTTTTTIITTITTC